MGNSTSWTEESIPDLSGKTAIVTGANSGIGYEAARMLAEKNAHVCMTGRSKEKLEAAAAKIRDGISDKDLVEIAVMDQASLANVKEFADNFSKTHSSLDILINNAGIMIPPTKEETADGFEVQMGVNHLSHFALTGHLLPVLLRTEHSRIVNVASSASDFSSHPLGVDVDDLPGDKGAYDRMQRYAQSKMANLLFTSELQRRLEEGGHNVCAVACHPGYSATNLQKDMPLGDILNSVVAQSAQMGALPTLYAAVEPSIKGGEYIGPDGLWGGYPKVVTADRRSHNPEVMKALWEKSEELTHVSIDIPPRS